MALTQSDAQRKNAIMLCDQLVKDGIVVQNQQCYKFTQQYLFSSPSYAASLLNGYPTNGLDAWKNQQG